jgi:hypothetical protein
MGILEILWIYLILTTIQLQPKRSIPSMQYVPVPARQRGGQQNQ